MPAALTMPTDKIPADKIDIASLRNLRAGSVITIVLDDAQITAIVVKHLADYWGVPESAIKGAVEVTDWGARCEGCFTYDEKSSKP